MDIFNKKKIKELQILNGGLHVQKARLYETVRSLNNTIETLESDKKIQAEKIDELYSLIKVLLSRLPEKRIVVTDKDIEEFKGQGEISKTHEILSFSNIYQLLLPEDYLKEHQ